MPAQAGATAEQIEACERFHGSDGVTAAVHLAYTLDMVSDALSQLGSKFESRLETLKKFSETDQKLLSDVGPQALRKAKSESNQADIKKVEGILQEVQARQKPTQQEIEHAGKGLADARTTDGLVKAVAAAFPY